MSLVRPDSRNWCSQLVLIGSAWLALTGTTWANLTTGLIGHWQLNEGNGLTAVDSSPAGDDGRLHNMNPANDWVTGVEGTALDFDGANDYVQTPVTVSKTFTWAVWIKMDTQSGFDSILTIPNSGGARDRSFLLMDMRGQNLSMWARGELGGHNLGVTGLQIGTWYHVVLVREGDNQSAGYKGYLNGALRGSRRSRSWGSIDPIRIAGRQGALNQSFDGQIDEVRIYNRALSAEEVAQLYDLHKPPGLKGHWPLDETSGLVASDVSGSLHHGAVLGNETWTKRCNDGGAYAMDGQDDSIVVSYDNDFDFQGAGRKFSASAWINLQSLQNDAGLIGRWRSEKESQWLLRYNATNKSIQWLVRQEDGAVRMAESSVNSIRQNVWMHVLGNADGSTLQVFIDGQSSGTSDAYASLADIGDQVDVELGVERSGTGSVAWFGGQMDDVRIYDKDLSQGEISIIAGALLGVWRLDDASGSTAADASGLGNHGALGGGPVWTSGQIDGGLYFDGRNDFVQTPVTVGKEFTWSLWMQMDSQNGYDSLLTIPNSGGAADANYMLLGMLGPNLSLWARDGVGNQTLGIRGLARDTWHHITFVRAGDNMNDGYRGYLNGVFTGSYRSRTWNSADPVRIGGRLGVLSQTFHGTIDEVRIYNRALCDDEIAQLPGGDVPKGLRIIRWQEVR